MININQINSFVKFNFYRGRVALYALLKALEIGDGDEVALQSFTCVANPEGILATGAKPVYVDIEESGVNMDSGDLAEKITSKTRAIIIQHTFGIPADMVPLLVIAEKKGIPIIEDCCHTLMSRYDNQMVGTFGVGSYYSFEWGKPVVSGIGGALYVNDLYLREKIEQQYVRYRKPSAKVDFRIRIQSIAHKILYRPSLFWPVRSLYHALGKIGAAESNYNPIVPDRIADDFSLKMSTYGQKRLRRKIAAIDKITEHSSLISTEYAAQITSPLVAHVTVSGKCTPVYCRYPLLAENKKKLLQSARKANVEMAEWYATPIHPLKDKDLALVHYREGECPNAEERCSQIVTLPTHPAVNKKDVKRMVQFFKNNSG